MPLLRLQGDLAVAVRRRLAVVLEAVPVLYTIVKLVGAAYLVWLGFRLVFPGKNSADPAISAKAPPRGRALRQSIVVEVLNPKTALFYLVVSA